MSLLQSITGLLKDPPPAFTFELSEAGLASAKNGKPPVLFFQEFEKDVISVSPLRDNVLRPDALLGLVKTAAPGSDNRKRRAAALILPDYSVRVSVLDFDSFPSDAKEQASLVRFRLKRSVPFDVESAAVSFHPQPSSKNSKRVDVVAAVAPLEVVARYEAPFRAANLQPGWVTTSTLAAVQLVPPVGLKVLAKRTGRILSIAVVDSGAVRLVRSIELAEVSAQEIVGHLFPTFAYIEDELSARPDMLLLCGFDTEWPHFQGVLQDELGVPVSALASRLGAPGEFNAGLLGYMESLEEA
jgi:type IV pilus assembly protein PilM